MTTTHEGQDERQLGAQRGARLLSSVDELAARRGWRTRVRAERLELDEELAEVLASTVVAVASAAEGAGSLDLALRWDGRCLVLALVVDGAVGAEVRAAEARRLAGWGAQVTDSVEGGMTWMRVEIACRDEATAEQVAA